MKMVKVAITGGIGSGKSTAVKYFSKAGYPVFSCDKIYKQIYNTATFQRELAETFPSCIKAGKIDKKLLSQLVFSNPSALKKLNQLSHERVMQALFIKMQQTDSCLSFAEVPLLLEGGYQDCFDYTIVVLRDKAKRIRSVCERDGLTEEQALARIKNQWDYDSKENLTFIQKETMYIVENHSTVDVLERQLEKVLLNLLDNMKQ